MKLFAPIDLTVATPLIVEQLTSAVKEGRECLEKEVLNFDERQSLEEEIKMLEDAVVIYQNEGRNAGLFFLHKECRRLTWKH
jgi:hypothetical protein